MPIGMALGERIHAGDLGVIAEDGGQRVEERALVVGAGAVEEEQGVLAGAARESVAGDAAPEALEVAIAGRDLVEEPQALGAGRPRGHHGRDLRAKRRRITRSAFREVPSSLDR